MNNSTIEPTKDNRQRRRRLGLPPPGRVQVTTEASMFRSVSMSVGPSPVFYQSTSATTATGSMDVNERYPPGISNSPAKTVLQKSHSAPETSTIVKNTTSAGFHANHENPTDRISGWRVTKLRPLPLIYPLERTAITIQPKSLRALTEEILEFMKARSIACFYNDQMGRVDGLTVNLLQFTVQLWRKGGPPAVNVFPPVVVEIQRRQGCCIEMQRLRQDLIRHLTHQSRDNGATMPLGDSNSTNNNLLPDKFASKEFLQALVAQSTGLNAAGETATLPYDLTSGRCLEGSFNICLSLLRSEMMDQNRLGLESLCMIADLSKSTFEQAHFVSSTVLANTDVQELMTPYFVRVEISEHNQSAHSMDIGEDDGDRTLDYERGNFFGGLHILALKAISLILETKAFVDGKKATEVTSKKLSNIESTTISLSTPFWNSAVQAMIYNIQVAHVRPMEAALSIRCLRLLHTMVPESCHAKIDTARTFDDMLLDARSHGKRYHSELEQETQALLSQLGLAY